jgi:tetratricopeptide (TPR) repeat protein
MAKPSLFIGSSVGNISIATAIQSSLQYDVTSTVWTQSVFGPSQYPLDSLEDTLGRMDFAILVCVPEDKTTIRDQQHATVRDNVIFELGMSIGKLSRSRTFLISPSGVDMHLPSDLLGLTPETFDSKNLQNLEAALGPACSKIREAMRKLGPFPRANTNVGLEAADRPEFELSSSGAHFYEPTPEWTTREYEWKYFLALKFEKVEAANKIDEAYRASPSASSPSSLAVWQASKEIAAMRAGQRADVPLIRSLASSFPDEPRLREFTGRALAYYGDERGAGEAFISAVNISSDMQAAARVTKRALDLASVKTEPTQVMALRQRLLEIPAESHPDKVAFVGAMESVAFAAKIEDIAAAIAEAGVSFAPEDHAARFELARRYSENDQNELSMLHYEAIPWSERGGMAWNNLGVSYARLQMSGMAITAYEKAAEMEETIAQGNLAQKLLSAGFFDDARKRTEATISIEGHHESLIGVLARISEARDSEVEAHNAAKAKASSRQNALKEIGLAALVAGGPNIVGEWDTADCTLTISDNGDGTYTGVGDVSREVSSRALGIGFGPRLNKSIERRQVRLELIRMGNAMEGTLNEEPAETPLGLLGMIERKKKLLLEVSNDGLVINGFETDYDTRTIEWHKTERGSITEPRLIAKG